MSPRTGDKAGSGIFFIFTIDINGIIYYYKYSTTYYIKMRRY